MWNILFKVERSFLRGACLPDDGNRGVGGWGGLVTRTPSIARAPYNRTRLFWWIKCFERITNDALPGGRPGPVLRSLHRSATVVRRPAVWRVLRVILRDAQPTIPIFFVAPVSNSKRSHCSPWRGRYPHAPHAAVGPARVGYGLTVLFLYLDFICLRVVTRYVRTDPFRFHRSFEQYSINNNNNNTLWILINI